MPWHKFREMRTFLDVHGINIFQSEGNMRKEMQGQYSIPPSPSQHQVRSMTYSLLHFFDVIICQTNTSTLKLSIKNNFLLSTTLFYNLIKTERVESTADDLEVGITQLQKSARCKEVNDVAFVRVKTIRNTIYRQYVLNAQRKTICHDDGYNNRIWVKIGVSIT